MDGGGVVTKLLDSQKNESEEQGLKGRLRSFLKSEGNIFLFMVVVFIFFSIANPRFSSQSNLKNIMFQLPFLVILSIGQAFPIITGGFDLSVGGQMCVVSVLCAMVTLKFGLFAGVASGLVVGGIMGMINGFLITKTRISALIATVGMMSITSGLALLITGGMPVQNMTKGFDFLGSGFFLNIPISFYITIVMIIATFILLQKTVFGRHLYATGGNAEAARLSGVNVNRIISLAYVICGVLAGLSAVILSSRVDSGIPTLGADYALQSIAAAVIGGCSLAGGSGTVLGATFGALLLAIINNGLDLMNISSYVEMMVVGVIIILAVYIDILRKKRA